MSGDETISLDELAEMADNIGAVIWLIGNRPRWCDVCLRPSIRRVVRRRIEIDIDGAARSETSAMYCLDESRFIR